MSYTCRYISQGFVNTAVYGLNRLVWQHLLALWEGCGCVRVTHTRGAHIGGGGEGERTSLLDTSVEGEYRRVVTSAHKQPLGVQMCVAVLLCLLVNVMAWFIASCTLCRSYTCAP